MRRRVLVHATRIAPTVVFGLALIATCDTTGTDIDLRGLQAIPDPVELDFANVQPAQARDYWELRHAMAGASTFEVLGSGGRLARSELPAEVIAALDAAMPGHGFAPRCLPAYCYDYIAGVAGGEVTVFATADSLRLFLGDLDTFQEAVLMVHGLGFTWSSSPAESGYRSRGDASWDFLVFELVLTCAPVQTDRVLLRVDARSPVSEANRETWRRDEGACI